MGKDFKRPRTDYTGQKFNRLTVIKDAPDRGKKRHAEFLCDCGNIKVMALSAVVCGIIHTCGCLMFPKIDNSDNIRNTRFYRLHRDMKTRCNNKNSQSYKNYGAKGISYDPAWDNFDNFYRDMYQTYFDGASLDRIDNSKGYSKENCRWVDPIFQGRNKGKLSNNKSGVTGVRWDEKEKGVFYATCHWYNLDGRKVQKSFSVSKYGLLESFAMACAYRDKMIAELNAQGAGYSENHGK